MTRFRRRAFMLLAAVALIPLASCSDTPEEAPAPEAASTSLADAVKSAPGMATAAAALESTGLDAVFDGPGSYTILVPDDDAFGALGEDRRMLDDPAQRAAVAAIIRDHIVPGFLLPDDIAEALGDGRGGAVEMTTMADHTLTFTKSGDDILVTSEDGANARLAGEALVANNGVAIPVDGLLKARLPR